MVFYLFCAIFVLTAMSYLLGRRKAVAIASYADLKLHSRPGYHGAYVAFWAGMPSLVLVLLWLLFQGPALDALILRTLPDAVLEGLGAGQRDLLLSEIKSVAAGFLFAEPAPHVAAAAERLAAWTSIARWAMVTAAVCLLLAGAVVARSRIAVAFRARQGVERALDGVMIFCSLVAILTTLGIVSSLLFESFKFFERVAVTDFLFGLSWEPQIPIRADQVAGLGAFGAVPVFAGTLLIAGIAMGVAVPVGLLAAIYMAEYATPRFRNIVKPVLEILAGVPTVVYGFFAVLIVAPALRQFGFSIGLDVAPNSAFAAGAVMGIMIIPFVSSLSDDALNAVPGSMREGSYGLGATKSETILQVLLPAALPGIMGGVLLAASRAIGETMIVVMAAGLIARLTANPFEGVTTVTVQIVTLLIGDTEFDSPKTLAAFALGLVLFIATLCLNVVALHIVQKYRERYD